MPQKPKSKVTLNALPKTRSGIKGLDEITGGGLPAGRPTRVGGAYGGGKTLMGVEFIVRGALEFGEPGVLMAFEEKAEELQMNVASLGFDLARMQRDKLVKIDHVHIDKSEIE